MDDIADGPALWMKLYESSACMSDTEIDNMLHNWSAHIMRVKQVRQMPCITAGYL